MHGIFRQISIAGDRLRRICGRADHVAIGAAGLALVLGLALNASWVARGMAQDESATPAATAVPMPPARPSTLASPAPPVATAPPQTPDPGVAGETSAPPWTPGKLLRLPPYTRARMHECALEWQKMKASGAATEKIWFTFAQSCLVR